MYRTVNIHIRPVVRSGDTAKGFILVVFEPAADEHDSEIILTSDEPVARQLEDELIRVKSQLRAASEQHDFQAEEMKASNEELQAMNEELRSAAEELETSKEELQSINEELRTVNQELKVKIEETSIASNNLQNIINSTDIGTIFLDRNFRVALYTPATSAIFNLIPADYGRLLTDITHKLNYRNLVNDAKTVLEKLSVIEKEVTSVDSKTFLMRVAPYRTDEDRINGVVVTFIDISERKAAEEALHRAEENYRQELEQQVEQRTSELKESRDEYLTLVENTPDVITRWNKELRLIYANTAFEALTGIKNDLLLGKTNTEMGHAGSLELSHSIQRALETGKMLELINAHKTPGGDIYFYTRITPERNLAGGVETILAIAREITDLKNAEKQLLELGNELAKRATELQRSNDDLRQFAHVASHDLKEPVRKISTFYSRIINEYEDSLPDAVKFYLERIKSSTDRMYAMIEGVLHYSKLDSMTEALQRVNLNETIRQVETDLEVVINSKQGIIEYASLPVIEGSPMLFHQLFYNLLLNSLKFTIEGKPPHIIIRSSEVMRNKATYAEITISDNGIGFDQKYAENIFNSFIRLNNFELYEGSGLGLPLCKKIVERYNGFISACSKINKGAVFTILFPYNNKS